MTSYGEYIAGLSRHCAQIDCNEQQRMLALKFGRDEDFILRFRGLARQLKELRDGDISAWLEQPEQAELVDEILRDWSSRVAALAELGELMGRIGDAGGESDASQSLLDHLAFIQTEMLWLDIPSALATMKKLAGIEEPPIPPILGDGLPSDLDERLWKLACLENTPEGYKAHLQDDRFVCAHVDEALARIATLNVPPEPEAPAVPQPGEIFRDWETGPELVVLPAGEFRMGSADNELDRWSNEGPCHQVSIGYSLAVGRYPVTFEDWDLCVADAGVRHRPADQGWGRGKRPVINVSWQDAQDYIAWLNRKTGQNYRLLTEAEWEYAARAGQGEKRFSWGDDPDYRQLEQHAWYTANSTGKTQPVGQKLANAFGLHDLHGNVAEWVEDTYRADYDAVPADGSAHTEGSRGAGRVLRGASWLDMSRSLRTAARDRITPDHRSYKIGFRIARNL